MSTRNSQTSVNFVRTELTPWKKPRQHICKPRIEFLNTGNVDFELFDDLGERNWISPPATEIRREDSKG
jgi:hypothetical protein